MAPSLARKSVASAGGKGSVSLNGLLALVVVVGAHVLIAAIGQRPVDDADPVVGLGIVRLNLDMFQVVLLRFLELLGIEGSAAHVVENGADSVDSREIIRIGGQDFLIFIDGLLSHADVLVGRRAGDVLGGIGGSQVKASVQKGWDREPWTA